jgi:hypothetical protein
MAAVTTAVAGGLALAGGVTSTVAGIQKTKEGKNLMQKGQNAIDSFQWQDIDGAIPIATEGTELMMEENARTAATTIDALEASGSRGVLGGAGKVQAATNDQNRQARAYLDDQIIKKAYTKLGMTEQRQAAELDGYGQMMNVGMGMKYQGRADVYNGLMSAGENIMAMGYTNANLLGGQNPNANRPNVSTVNALTPNMNMMPLGSTGLSQQGAGQIDLSYDGSFGF